jgi:hypothetical protein
LKGDEASCVVAKAIGPLNGLAAVALNGLFVDANGFAAGAKPASAAGAVDAAGATMTDGSENGFVDVANGFFGPSEPWGTIAGEASPSYEVTGAAIAAGAGLAACTGGVPAVGPG